MLLDWELQARLKEIDRELVELAGKRSSDARDQRAELQSERIDRERELQELKRRKARLAELAGDVSRTIDPVAGNFIGDDDGFVPRLDQRIDYRRCMAKAHQVIDRANHDGDFSESAAVRADGLVRREPTGNLAAYIAAVGDPAYKRGFLKVVGDPHGGTLLSPAERDAIAHASECARQLSLGGTAGYAVPITLDPTLNLTSDSAINPIRAISRVETIVTTEWKGVTSAGVTAAFAAENTEASDNSPTLSQPTIITEKAQAFVPFSIEAGEDWPALTAELTKCFRDAKDRLEAEKYMNGAGHGSTEPSGLVANLAAPSIIDTAAAGTFAIADVYSTKEALAPRWQPNAQWLASNVVLDKARRFTGPGSAEFPVLTDTPTLKILGKPASECSTMSILPSTHHEKIMIYGDFSQFCIVDRVGMTIEIIPHLVGGVRRYPIGQRGAYTWWRTSSGILADSAFSILRVKST